MVRAPADHQTGAPADLAAWMAGQRSLLTGPVRPALPTLMRRQLEREASAAGIE